MGVIISLSRQTVRHQAPKALPAKLELAPPVLPERVTSKLVLVETCKTRKLKLLLYLAL